MKAYNTPHCRPKTHLGPRMFPGPKGEEGSTLFEFAMVALLLSTFLVGIIYGGTMAYDRAVLANAVAVGARTLAAGQGDPTVCTDAQTALKGAVYGLSTSLLYIETPPTFTAAGGGAGSSSCSVTTGTGPGGTSCSSTSPCQILVGGEFATISATYPCNMYFPRLGINLCPMQGTSGTTTNPNCPNSAYCIISTATVRIE